MSEAVTHLYQYMYCPNGELAASVYPWCMAIAYAVIKVISSINQASATDKYTNCYQQQICQQQ